MRIFLGTLIFFAISVLLLKWFGTPETWQNVLALSLATGVAAFTIFFVNTDMEDNPHDEYAFKEAFVGIVCYASLILSIIVSSTAAFFGTDATIAYLVAASVQGLCLVVLLVLETLGRVKRPTY